MGRVWTSNGEVAFHLLWEADEVDGYHRPRRPLASLHANPAHSALRRARHFHEARRSLGLVQGIDPRCLAPCGHLIAYQFAEARAMWSVR